jgi:hypothetical protein
MRIHLLTSLALLTGATAIHAQTQPSAQTTSSAATIPAPNSKLDEAPTSETPVLNTISPPPAGHYIGVQGTQNPFYPIWDQAGGAAQDVGPLIMFGQHEPKAMDEMAEDLNIFGFLVKRNLEKALGEQAPEMRMGVPMLLESGGRHVHASYIEGFGALFNMRVAIPIVAPSSSTAKSEYPEAQSEWDKARAALYGGGAAAAQMEWAETSARKVEFYDAKLVDILKKQVLESLKSAGNLRHVKPDEWIVVTITGSPNAPDAIVFPTSGAGAAYNLTGTVMDSRTVQVQASGRRTIMAFRVKKSAVDAFAAKGSSAEQFAGKVEVTSYLGAEAAIRSSGGVGVGYSTGPAGGQNFFHAVPQP